MAFRRRPSEKHSPFRLFVIGSSLLALTMCTVPTPDTTPQETQEAQTTEAPAPIARYDFTASRTGTVDGKVRRIKSRTNRYLSLNRLIARLNAVSQDLYEIKHPEAPPPRLHEYHITYKKITRIPEGDSIEFEITLTEGENIKQKNRQNMEDKVVLAYDMIDIQLTSKNKNLKIITESIETRNLETLRRTGDMRWKWKIKASKPADYEIDILSKPVSSQKNMHQPYQNIDTIKVEAGFLDTIIFYLKKNFLEYLLYFLGLILAGVIGLFIRESFRKS